MEKEDSKDMFLYQKMGGNFEKINKRISLSTCGKHQFHVQNPDAISQKDYK